jgi:Uma2 family endonuclease
MGTEDALLSPACYTNQMNEYLRHNTLSGTTRAAEGLARRRWSVAEIEAMVAEGIILEDERFELIGGEVVPMSPKGSRHELVKKALQQYWTPLIVGSPIDLITETTLRVGPDEFYEPDFLFWPRSIPLKDVTAASAFLIVEVADTSLRYDLGTKADIYSRLGLRELWVINADTLVTTVHRGPQSTHYATVETRQPTERIEPARTPDLSVTLGTLDLG